MKETCKQIEIAQSPSYDPYSKDKSRTLWAQSNSESLQNADDIPQDNTRLIGTMAQKIISKELAEDGSSIPTTTQSSSIDTETWTCSTCHASLQREHRESHLRDKPHLDKVNSGLISNSTAALWRSPVANHPSDTRGNTLRGARKVGSPSSGTIPGAIETEESGKARSSEPVETSEKGTMKEEEKVADDRAIKVQHHPDSASSSEVWTTVVNRRRGFGRGGSSCHRVGLSY